MALDHLGDAAGVADVGADAENHGAAPACAPGRDPSPRASRRTAGPRPSKIASPMRKWPILSSTISASVGDLFRGEEIEAMAGMDFEAGVPAPAQRRRAMRSNSAARRSGIAGRQARRTRRRCEFRSPARRSRTAASICAGSAAMNSDTRMPAAASSPTAARNASRWPAASSPPSVVRSARRSGTMQAACGRSLQAMRDHLCASPPFRD